MFEKYLDVIEVISEMFCKYNLPVEIICLLVVGLVIELVRMVSLCKGNAIGHECHYLLLPL